MKLELENMLLYQIRSATDRSLGNPWPRDIIEGMVRDGLIQSPKQAHATLEKFVRRGWYDYGTALDLGWLTPSGAEQVSK